MEASRENFFMDIRTERLISTSLISLLKCLWLQHYQTTAYPSVLVSHDCVKFSDVHTFSFVSLSQEDLFTVCTLTRSGPFALFLVQWFFPNF